MASTILIRRKTTTGAPAAESLQTGEMCLVVPDKQVYIKNSDNTVTLLNGGGAGAPAGSDKEVQFNDNGSFATAVNVEVESGNLALVNTLDPTPIAGKAIIYSKEIAGRTLVKWQPPSGIDNPFQSGLFFNQVSLIQAGSGSVISVFACAITNIGTITHPLLAATNIKAQSRRFVATSAATVGSLASTRVQSLECWRGNNQGVGGFFVVVRFGLTTTQAGMRMFVGLSSRATTAATNVDPLSSTTDAKIGMAINTNTGSWNLINNTAGVAPTVLGLGASFLVNTTDMLELILFAKPNDIAVAYRIKNLQTNVEVSGSLLTNLPANTDFLGRQIYATNNATAALVAWDCSRFGLETDF